MTSSRWKVFFLGAGLLLAAAPGYADNWKAEGHYQVKDGLVKDPKTGLMWMRCSMGQKWDGTTCQGSAARYSWDKAMEVTEGFEFAGHKDWRVPTHEELKSLVNCSGGLINRLDKAHSQCDGEYDTPTIFHAAFPETPANWFWSSSPQYEDWFGEFPFTYLGNFSWVVNFSSGLDVPSHRDDGGHLRLVRNGK